MHIPTEPGRINCPYCVCNCIHKDHQGLAFVSRDYHALRHERVNVRVYEATTQYLNL
jgi:hypothetical protein